MIIIEDEQSDSDNSVETLVDVVEELTDVVESVTDTFAETVQDIVESVIEEADEDVSSEVVDQHSVQLGAITAAIEALMQRIETVESNNPNPTNDIAQPVDDFIEVEVEEIVDVPPKSFSGKFRRAWFGE